MAALGTKDRTGARGEGAAVRQSVPQAYPTAATHHNTRPQVQETLVYMQCCGQEEPPARERGGHMNQEAVFPPTPAPTMPLRHAPASREAAYSFRSPESVEMDEIMAAMVLTSLSCSPVVQSPPQTDPGPGGSSAGGGGMECAGGVLPSCCVEGGPSAGGDMECGGGELSDSGSSGYWSWDHGNGSPAASTSATETDTSPDEGLHMELEQGEELSARKGKSSFRGLYKCLWPSCGKVLASSVGMKRHIRVLHLGSGSDQSQREEDFYYTKISCEATDPAHPAAPSASQPAAASSTHLPWASCGSPAGSDLQQASASSTHLPWASCGSPPGSDLQQASSSSAHLPWASCASPPGSDLQQASASSAHLPWASCGSPTGSDLQMAPMPRPRSHSSSGVPGRPSPLSQSAPSSFWQIHSEHLYQACSPVQVTVASRTPTSQCWTPTVAAPNHSTSTTVKPRCRSVSVGEQWLQQNSAPSRLQTMSASPSRAHCSFRKARGEAKKCRKVYGVERKDQWCTACRWKKACQRFPD